MAVDILSANQLFERNYIEPYSGGCGLALSLLFAGHVSKVHLNDIDRSVWAFWHSVLHRTDDLASMIDDVAITVEEWERQRAIQSTKAVADALALGFSTFFLNRTNRSGIIHSGGIIGGRDQAGPWKMDCRFNRSDLIARIRRVARYGNRISIYNEDAEAFLARIGTTIPSSSVAYIDPPYYEKGSQLYRNAYRRGDHTRIAQHIRALTIPWFLTYDNTAPIRDLYEGLPSAELDIGYSVQTKRRGSELLVLSDGLQLPFEAAVAA